MPSRRSASSTAKRSESPARRPASTRPDRDGRARERSSDDQRENHLEARANLAPPTPPRFPSFVGRNETTKAYRPSRDHAAANRRRLSACRARPFHQERMLRRTAGNQGETICLSRAVHLAVYLDHTWHFGQVHTLDPLRSSPHSQRQPARTRCSRGTLADSHDNPQAMEG